MGALGQLSPFSPLGLLRPSVAQITEHPVYDFPGGF